MRLELGNAVLMDLDRPRGGGRHDHLARIGGHASLINEVKTPNPVACSPNATLAEAMSEMAKHHVGQLPVVEGGKLVGLISVGDLIEAIYAQIEAEDKHLMDYLHGRG